MQCLQPLFPGSSLTLLCLLHCILNKLITRSEVFNGNCDSKYTRHDKQYYHLLDQGWKLGAVNGQDNHKINFNNNSNLTVYIGNELSKKALIDAFRKHRTYSTESRYLKHFSYKNTILTKNQKNSSIFCKNML